MVKSSTALVIWIIQNASLVVSEHSVGRANANADWLHSNGSLVLLHGLSNKVTLTDTDSASNFLVSALAIFGRVLVVPVVGNWSSLGIIPSVVLDATIASFAFRDAVDQLLLGELAKLTSPDEMSALHTCDGRECPARAAPTLVLDWQDSTFLSPVDRALHHSFVELEVLSLISLSSWKLTEDFLEFGISESGELIVTGPVRVLLLVDFVHNPVGLEVQLEPEVEFLLGTVRKTVLVDVIDKLLFRNFNR